MSTSFVVGQVLVHTPVWVWGLLAFITAIGLRQMADYTVTARRLVGVSVGWSALSIWSASNAFGAQPEVVIAWAAGIALAVAANQWLGWPRSARTAGDGRYALEGSVWPLLTMWSVFAVRYVTSVMLVLDPALKHDTVFSLAVPLAYGLLSGIFVARTVRILRSAPAAGSLALA